MEQDVIKKNIPSGVLFKKKHPSQKENLPSQE